MARAYPELDVDEELDALVVSVSLSIDSVFSNFAALITVMPHMIKTEMEQRRPFPGLNFVQALYQL